MERGDKRQVIKITTKRYRRSEILQEAKNPDLSMLRDKPSFKSTISDYEGLFINYGFRETAYPYTQQNAYSEEREREVTVAVLENDEIYAEFLPTLGGRLWTLYDKRHKKNIIYKNDVIRFRNLAIRNAWFSGGVEWNCGVIGHSPFTCSQMYCAEVKGANGEEVLRFYEYERIRGVYYQMDFWLEGNRLMSAVRIENPNEEVVPMYWWSNMATPEYPGGRVAVAASRAYNNSDGMGIKNRRFPLTAASMCPIPRIYPILSIISMIYPTASRSSSPTPTRTASTAPVVEPSPERAQAVLVGTPQGLGALAEPADRLRRRLCRDTGGTRQDSV